jgi:hypothetical protein
MVKPAAHDSFYKCSTHFSLNLEIIISIILLYLVRVLEVVDRLNLKLSDGNRVRSSRSSDKLKKSINRSYILIKIYIFINFRGYSLIGKTRTLHVFNSGSIPDNSSQATIRIILFVNFNKLFT